MMRRGTTAGLAGFLVIAAGIANVHAHDPITWRTMDGGGPARVSAGAYELGGTIGQPDAGSQTGGGYSLRGGFWRGGPAVVTGVSPEPVAALPLRFLRARPNPTRSQSRLGFDLPAPAQVRLSVYDVAGRLVNSEELGLVAAGHHERPWRAVDFGGRPLSGGVYFLRLEAGLETAVQRVVVIR